MRTDELVMQPKKKRGRPRKVLGVGGAMADRTRLQRTSLHERATERLRTLIVRGDLAPDSVLIESELCDLLGVSRTPLREALKLLAVQGLVELRQNRSARIPPIREEDIRDLFEAVSGIERVAAELAARKITPARLDGLRRLQDEIERHFAQGDLQAYFTVNQEIHRAIVAAGRERDLARDARMAARPRRARALSGPLLAAALGQVGGRAPRHPRRPGGAGCGRRGPAARRARAAHRQRGDRGAEAVRRGVMRARIRSTPLRNEETP